MKKTTILSQSKMCSNSACYTLFALVCVWVCMCVCVCVCVYECACVCIRAVRACVCVCAWYDQAVTKNFLNGRTNYRSSKSIIKLHSEGHVPVLVETLNHCIAEGIGVAFLVQAKQLALVRSAVVQVDVAEKEPGQTVRCTHHVPLRLQVILCVQGQSEIEKRTVQVGTGELGQVDVWGKKKKKKETR